MNLCVGLCKTEVDTLERIKSGRGLNALDMSLAFVRETVKRH